jgi:hypothetical protein
LNPILHTLAGTGTQWGWSYWTGQPTCSKQQALRKANPSVGLSGIKPLDIGTIFHALCDIYYTMVMDTEQDADLMDTTMIEWVDPMEHPESYVEKIIQEADRVFQAYRLNHEPLEFGEPLATEEIYTVEDFYGLHTFQTRPDLEIEPDEETAKLLGLPGAGIYTVDHKTWAYPNANDSLYCESELRFHSCMAAYVKANPDRADFYRGNIVNAIYKSRNVTFKRFFLPYSRLDESRLAGACKLMADAENERANPLACSTRYENCKFFRKGCEGF